MSNSNLTCNAFYSKQGNTTKFDFTEGKYGEIPFTLTINAVGWVALIILFAILRKIAWNYGRIALVSRAEEKWTSLFYGDHDNTSLGSQESLDTHMHSQDKGLFSWVIAIFKLKDSDILQKCGKDAIQYITFQRYLLIYMSIVCVLSIAIIVPVNFSGNNIGNATDFGHTTIGNLDPDSPLLWIHCILSLVFLVLMVILMRRFSQNLEYQDDEQATRTLMVSNIPAGKCYKNLISQHFVEAYPEVYVTDVQFAYNISNLVVLDQKRKQAMEARMNSQKEFDITGKRPLMRPHAYGRCCCRCCGLLEEMDAIDYYTEAEAKWKSRCEEEKATAYQTPLGVAFVSFQSETMAIRVHVDFSTHCKSGPHSSTTTSVYAELDVQSWVVQFAPSPENIYWENLTKSGLFWWIKTIAINCVLVILLFFFTSPPIVLNNLNKIQYFKEGTEGNPFLQQFLPTLLMWTFAALLPNIVYYSDQFIGHWTRTAEHHSVMIKSFIFLLLMVLILPSLGLTSANALFQWFIKDRQQDFRWNCIFLSGNGAFFVNYIITSAFIGTALELMRFSELIIYAFRLFFAHSSAEETAIRKTTVWEFQYGTQYGWMLCVFAVVIAYSLPCPLIVPFGLVYIGFKHLIDRYNLYFAYKPSHINKGIHTTAISFVIIAVIILQCNIVFFTAVRSEGVNPVFAFSFVALFVTVLMFTGRVCFGWFKYLDFSKYKMTANEEETQQFGNDGRSSPSEETLPNGGTPFVASVLLNPDLERDVQSSGQGGGVASSSVGVASYGATENRAINSDVQTISGRESLDQSYNNQQYQ